MNLNKMIFVILVIERIWMILVIALLNFYVLLLLLCLNDKVMNWMDLLNWKKDEL